MEARKMNLKEMMNQNDFNIVTPRTVLVPLNRAHFCEYYREFTKEITQYQYPDPFISLEEAEKVLTDFIQQRIEGNTLVCIITDSMGGFIGNVEAHSIDTAKPEVGVWIAQRYQHQGYANEALTGIMDFLRMHSQVEYFIYEADVRNEGSMRLIKKLKGKKQGHESFATESGKQLELDTFFIY
jgi:RimJ/RimL family protein N-acetyltransferase